MIVHLVHHPVALVQVLVHQSAQWFHQVAFSQAVHQVVRQAAVNHQAAHQNLTRQAVVSPQAAHQNQVHRTRAQAQVTPQHVDLTSKLKAKNPLNKISGFF